MWKATRKDSTTPWTAKRLGTTEGELVENDIEKGKVLSVFFASVFISKTGLWESHLKEQKEILEQGRFTSMK